MIDTKVPNPLDPMQAAATVAQPPQVAPGLPGPPAPVVPAAPAPAPPAPMPTPGAANPFAEQAKTISDTGQYNATTKPFDESKSAAGRVAAITSQDGPLMQLAETRARQEANRSGLLNSSMAVGAGQAAVIGAATPLATTDAQLSQQMDVSGMQATNDAARANAQIRAEAAGQGVKLSESARQFGINEQGTNDRFGQDQGNRLLIQAREAASRQTIAQMGDANKLAAIGLENTWRKDLNANENLSKAWGTMMEGVNQIQTNKDLDGATKTQLVQQRLDQFAAFAAWSKTVSGVDVGDLLTFNTAPPMTGPAASGATTANQPAGQVYQPGDQPYEPIDAGS